jgi:Amt family ammonium transporter
MKRLFALFTLLAVLCGLSATAYAEEVSAAVSAVAATATATSAVAAAPAVAAPVPNKGDTAWMLVATLLVIMMSIPGLALFYGGLVRSKNMLSILMQVFSIFAMIIVLWSIYGYSLAFTEGNAFIGGFDRLFLKGIFDPVSGHSAKAWCFPSSCSWRSRQPLRLSPLH